MSRAYLSSNDYIKIPKANIKRFSLYALLGLFGLVFGLLLMEIGLRIFLPQETYSRVLINEKGCHKKGTVTPIAFLENCDYEIKTQDFVQTVHINSQGFRGKEIKKQKDKNIFRILITGDSFIFGHGVEDRDTVWQLLEDNLNMLKVFDDKKVEVVNGGAFGGSSPDVNLLAVRQMLLDGYDADMLIMGMFIYNDLSDMDLNKWVGVEANGLPKRIESKKFEVTEDGFYITKDSELASVYKNKLLRNSHVVIYLTKNVPDFWRRIESKLGIRSFVPDLSDATDDSYSPVHFEDCVFGNGKCHRRFLHLFDDLTRVFLSGQGMFSNKSNSPRFLVLLEPADFQIYPEASSKYSKYGGKDFAYSQENPQPQKRLKEMLDEKSVPYLDLLPAFREHKEPKTYYPHDGHWNALGTKLAADEITKWIIANVRN